MVEDLTLGPTRVSIPLPASQSWSEGPPWVLSEQRKREREVAHVNEVEGGIANRRLSSYPVTG